MHSSIYPSIQLVVGRRDKGKRKIEICFKITDEEAIKISLENLRFFLKIQLGVGHCFLKGEKR